MKDEVPPALIDAHVKSVEQAMKDGKKVDSQFNLDKSGIAGIGSSQEEGTGLAPGGCHSPCVLCFIVDFRVMGRYLVWNA